MTNKLELYKCHVCGNLTQIIIAGEGELICCGEPMENLQPHAHDNDELSEKHVPQIESFESKRYVTLKHHPMNEEHYIHFIEVYPKDKSELYLKFFNPNETPEADITHFEENINALEHCNIHGLWRNNND